MKENAFYLFGYLTWNKHYKEIHLLTLNSSSHLANTLRIEKSHKYKRSRFDIKHYQQSKALHLCKQISSRKSATSTSKQTYQKTLVAPWTSADAYRISVSLLSICTSNNCGKKWSNYSTFKLRSPPIQSHINEVEHLLHKLLQNNLLNASYQFRNRGSSYPFVEEKGEYMGREWLAPELNYQIKNRLTTLRRLNIEIGKHIEKAQAVINPIIVAAFIPPQNDNCSYTKSILIKISPKKRKFQIRREVWLPLERSSTSKAISAKRPRSNSNRWDGEVSAYNQTHKFELQFFFKKKNSQNMKKMTFNLRPPKTKRSINHTSLK